MGLRDADTLPEGEALDCDVCIVGTGPAGQALLKTLARAGLSVCLLESGGLKHRRKTNDLNDGVTTGADYPNPGWGRRRQIGGASNKWLVEIAGRSLGARFAPLDPLDFEKRDWIPDSGWPITRQDLDPYYRRAHEMCGIGAFSYDAESWMRAGDGNPFEAVQDVLKPGVFQFGSKSKWNLDAVRSLAEALPNTRLVYHASVSEVVCDRETGAATGVRFLDQNRRSFEVRARVTVLAVGTIETSRLLLLSRALKPAGLGNDHGVVGRYFMDHPQCFHATLKPVDRGIFARARFFDLRHASTYSVMGKLQVAEEVSRRDQLPNACFLLFPRRKEFLSQGFNSFFQVSFAVLRKSVPPDIVGNSKRMLKGSADLAKLAALWAIGRAQYSHLSRGGWSAVKNPGRDYDLFELFSLVEQLPDPSNRIELDDRRDYLGVEKVKINWRFGERDRQGVENVRNVFSEAMRMGGIGEARFPEEPYTYSSSVHPLGGARMGTDRATSVVDSNLQVHGTPRLFVAGGAVFPTGGYVNPTLTVVALSARLGDFLANHAGLLFG